MVSSDVADVAILMGQPPETNQHAMLVLLDVGWVSHDLERYVGHVVGGANDGIALLVVSQDPLPVVGLPDSWSIALVPDIARVATAFGAECLPATLVVGTLDETRQRIETIVRWQERVDAGRASGAISADELRQ